MDKLKYVFSDTVRDNNEIRKSFDALAQKTFGLSFEAWYRRGYWQKAYVPHVLMDGNRVVANVSASLMDFKLQGINRRYVQLGTVMTDSDFRCQGLSKHLLNLVIKKYAGFCQGIFLFANDTVLDFYPKFGFVPAREYCRIIEISPLNEDKPVKLNVDNKPELELLLAAYNKGNPFSEFSMVNNTGMLMFYCSQFLKDHIYYYPQKGVAVIAEPDGDNMICYDIFGSCDCCITELLSPIANKETKNLQLGFTPKDTRGFKETLYKEENSQLFMFEGKENPFSQNKLMFPLLSHA